MLPPTSKKDGSKGEAMPISAKDDLRLPTRIEKIIVFIAKNTSKEVDDFELWTEIPTMHKITGITTSILSISTKTI